MKKEEIEHLATLARIELDEKEVQELTSDISSFLEYVSKVNEITAGSDDEKSVGALHNVLREDGEPHEPEKHTEELLGSVPSRDGRYVKVKKILHDQ